MAFGNRLKDYIDKCNELGLQPVPTRKRRNPDRMELSIKDCLKALQDYYINERKNEGTYSPFMDYIMKQDEPMLARLIKDMPEETQKNIWLDDDSDWIFEEKIDGCRARLCWDKNWGWDMYSRNLSVTDFLPISYKEQILLPSIDPTSLGVDNFILDCEIIPKNDYIDKDIDGVDIIADTQLNLIAGILGALPELSHKMQSKNPIKFVVFDVIMFNNSWKTDLELKDRKGILNTIFNDISSLMNGQIELVPSKPDNMTKQDYYNWLISKGKEGIVAKNIHTKYDSSGRRRGEWVKIKRSVTQSLAQDNLGDTVDAFVIGFDEGTVGTANEGLVGTLKFGVYLTDINNDYIEDEAGMPLIHHIATISGFSQELREAISTKDENGNVALRADVYGKVAEIDGQDVSAKTHRFAHARLLNWRNDRSANTCKFQQSVLNKLVL